MNLDDMITLLEVHRTQRNVQSRRKPTANDPNPTWYPVKKDFTEFDFHRYEFRIAPVDKEVWAIFDHDKDDYLDELFGNPSNATQRIVAMVGNPPCSPLRFEPVCLVPRHVEV
jgi:hypothetical protein